VLLASIWRSKINLWLY